MSGLYLRPLGLLYGAPAEAAIGAGLALRLAGGPIGFTIAELIEGTPRDNRKMLVNAASLAETTDPDMADLVRRVTSPRSGFAGLSAQRLASGRPVLMAIVNVTPDSFSDGGLYDTKEAAVQRAAELVAAGAEIIDIGGESTRPGSDTVAETDELDRVVPVIEALAGISAEISVDTRKAQVAVAAASKGATLFNDVSALTFDPESLLAAIEAKLDVVLMHAQGEPKTMQDNPSYDDVVLEVYDYLAERISAVTQAGLAHSQIAVDPGIGFGKTIAQNLTLLNQLSIFHGLGVPLLVGASRKRFIEGISGEKNPRDREPGSQAAAIAAAAQGAQILRVHDVAGSRQALTVWTESIFGPDVLSRSDS